jgi:hypothetical protein
MTGWGRPLANGRSSGRGVGIQLATAAGMISVDTGDADAVMAALRRLPLEIRKELSVTIRGNAQIIANTARQLLRAGANAGFSERVEGQASPPGGAPATQSGLLRKSIQVRRGRRDGLSWRVSAAFYARYLEVGAQRAGRGGTLDPRPFLTIARERNAELIRIRTAAAIERALQRFNEGSV